MLTYLDVSWVKSLLRQWPGASREKGKYHDCSSVKRKLKRQYSGKEKVRHVIRDWQIITLFDSQRVTTACITVLKNKIITLWFSEKCIVRVESTSSHLCYIKCLHLQYTHII